MLAVAVISSRKISVADSFFQKVVMRQERMDHCYQADADLVHGSRHVQSGCGQNFRTLCTQL